MGDEGRPFGVGFQDQASNHHKRLSLRVMVVSIVEESGTDLNCIVLRLTRAAFPSAILILTKRFFKSADERGETQVFFYLHFFGNRVC
jgi:hypothetical protein